MTDAGFEVLSALLDREPVDADDLARVLEEPSGRRALVDFVRVRQSIAADSEDVTAGGLGSLPVPSSAGPSLLRAIAAVMLFALAAAGGAWTHAELTKERPPAPDRIVRFQPGVDWK